MPTQFHPVLVRSLLCNPCASAPVVTEEEEEEPEPPVEEQECYFCNNPEDPPVGTIVRIKNFVPGMFDGSGCTTCGASVHPDWDGVMDVFFRVNSEICRFQTFPGNSIPAVPPLLTVGGRRMWAANVTNAVNPTGDFGISCAVPGFGGLFVSIATVWAGRLQSGCIFHGVYERLNDDSGYGPICSPGPATLELETIFP